MARELGVSQDFYTDVARGLFARVLADFDERLRDLYGRLADSRGKSVRASNYAAAHGWHGPLAWDDIDDPDATPEPDVDEVALSRDVLAAERITEIWLLASAGQKPEQIAERLDMSVSHIRDRLIRNFPHLYLELTA